MGRRDLALALAVALLAAPVEAGTVSGRVVFRGNPPLTPPIEIAKDRDTCGDTVPADALHVSSDGGVRGAVIHVDAPAAAPAPAGEVVLENRRCRFVPRVLAVRVGSELAVVNTDPVLHNLRAWLGKRHVFNVVQPNQGQTSRRTIKTPGVIALTCDTHTHMSGFILAFDHPWFTTSDDDGRFVIDGVPAGPRRVQLWHQGWNVVERGADGRIVWDPPRALAREVTVPEHGTVRVTFELTATP